MQLNLLKTVANSEDGEIRQFPSVKDAMLSEHEHGLPMEPFRRRDRVLSIFAFPDPVVRLVAYDAGFVALTKDGRVWTWGDARYPACLARDLCEER